LAPRKGRDGEVAVAVRERPERAAQVGVAEEERTRGSSALSGRQRLSLATARKRNHDRAGPPGLRRSPVLGASVDDDHLGAGKLLAEATNRLPHSSLLVAGGNEDGDRFRSVTGSVL
jgi:hypothetical protein